MKTRILILAALAAALLSCSGPAVEGRWKDDASSEEDGQMTAVFEINPDGNVRILIDTKETYETLGVFTASTVMPRSTASANRRSISCWVSTLTGPGGSSAISRGLPDRTAILSSCR